MSKIELIRTSLAAKYRPKTLDDLVGQDSIVSILKSRIKTLKIPNAFLLVGPTGCGKTTTARLIARYLNCDTLSACGKCPNCIAMDSGTHRDYKELNAADSRGIDDVRSLIQEARLMPSMGNLRIFVVDEAQQLTPQAAQAMLKQLEEPTDKTLWIICSMEPEKLLPALANRCQRLTIKTVDKDTMLSRLKLIVKKEKLKLPEDAYDIVVEYSMGQMRLALQNLDAVIQYLDSNPEDTAEAAISGIKKVFEVTDDLVMIKLLACVWSGNPKPLLKTILDGSDYFMLSKKLVEGHIYLMQRFLNVEHSKIWHTPTLKKLYLTVVKQQEKAGIEFEDNVELLHTANAALNSINELRSKITTFGVSEVGTFTQCLIKASTYY